MTGAPVSKTDADRQGDAFMAALAIKPKFADLVLLLEDLAWRHRTLVETAYPDPTPDAFKRAAELRHLHRLAKRIQLGEIDLVERKKRDAGDWSL